MDHDSIENFFNELIDIFLEKNKDSICDKTINLSSTSIESKTNNSCC